MRPDANVVVAGAGPAGICAALAASDLGASVVLIEQYGFVGGNASFIPSILSFSTATGEQVIRGLPQKLIDCIAAKGGTAGHVPRPGNDRPPVTVVNSEVLKSEALRLLGEAGVALMLHTFVVGVSRRGHRITGLRTASKSGIRSVRGRAFVDCTGDGDVAASARVPFDKGRGADGLMQPCTLLFEVAGVQVPDFLEYLRGTPSESYLPVSYYEHAPEFVFSGLSAKIALARGHGDWPFYRNELILITTRGRPGCVWVSVNNAAYVDGTNAADLSEAEVRTRTDVPCIVEFLRRYVPGFRKCFLNQTAHQVGVRDSRRITGKYVLSEADVLEGRRFHDAIAQGSYWIDVHDPDPLHRHPECSEGSGPLRFVHKPYDIPFRALTPPRISNLVVAGRCISATFLAQGAIRVMASCMATGQAAGTAAALCAREGCAPGDLDIAVLQRALVESGEVLLAGMQEKPGCEALTPKEKKLLSLAGDGDG